MQRFGAKARLTPLKSIRPALARSSGAVRTAIASGDVAVGDALVDAGYLRAVSGLDGAFAVPAFPAAEGRSVPLRGERRDIGLRGPKGWTAA